MKALLITLVALAILLAGCTSNLKETQEAHQALKDMEFESDEGGADGCDRTTSRFQDARSATLTCEALAAGKTEKVELGPCQTGEDDANMWSSVSGHVEAGELRILITGDGEVLLDETFSTNDGEFYSAAAQATARTYEAELQAGADFKGEVTLGMGCTAA